MPDENGFLIREEEIASLSEDAIFDFEYAVAIYENIKQDYIKKNKTERVLPYVTEIAMRISIHHATKD